MPSQNVLDNYYDTILNSFPDSLKNIKRTYGISFAEAKDDALTQVKELLIANLESSANEKSF